MKKEGGRKRVRKRNREREREGEEEGKRKREREREVWNRLLGRIENFSRERQSGSTNSTGRQEGNQGNKNPSLSIMDLMFV